MVKLTFYQCGICGKLIITKDVVTPTCNHPLISKKEYIKIQEVDL